MKDFLLYFLGKGDTEEFASFAAAHFLPILLMVAVITVMFALAYLLWYCKDRKAKKACIAAK